MPQKIKNLEDPRAWRSGILQLIKMYTQLYIGLCPLCEIAEWLNRYYFGRRTKCSRCPWVVFRGETCWEADYGETPVKRRLPRLRGWLKRVENQLKREGK